MILSRNAVIFWHGLKDLNSFVEHHGGGNNDAMGLAELVGEFPLFSSSCFIVERHGRWRRGFIIFNSSHRKSESRTHLHYNKAGSFRSYWLINGEDLKHH